METNGYLCSVTWFSESTSILEFYCNTVDLKELSSSTYNITVTTAKIKTIVQSFATGVKNGSNGRGERDTHVVLAWGPSASDFIWICPGVFCVFGQSFWLSHATPATRWNPTSAVPSGALEAVEKCQ